MSNKKIVTIQDISCYGQCSITVALPILSAFGFETAIVPSAILSTHTSGFKNFTVHDLSCEIPKIINHWQNENIKFDLLYAGYLGETKHMDLVKQMKETLLRENGIFVLDPVMGDNGKLYPAFNNEYVKEMANLLRYSDIIVPNLTEACFITNTEYKTNYDKNYILDICNKLQNLGAKNIILTGISYENNKTGVVVFNENNYWHYEHEKIPTSFHGTGDIYTSTFIANFLKTNDMKLAAKKACEFVVECILNTIDDPDHKYGVKFEPVLSKFINK